MKLIIGNRAYSSWSMRGWLALKHAGFEFEELVVPLFDEAWEQRRQGDEFAPSLGKVPILWDGDTVIWDSLAIIGVGGVLSGQQAREKMQAGADAVQEVAFTLADGMAYVKAAIDAGLAVDDPLGHHPADAARAGDTDRGTAIALLAPAYNEAREVDATRLRAIEVAVAIRAVLEPYIAGHIAKWDDTFNPRAFGDLTAAAGVSTILIESGGIEGDPQKQRLRKLNFLALAGALDAIASGTHAGLPRARYEELPENGRTWPDLRIAGGTLVLPVLHEMIPVNMNTLRLEVVRTAEAALITKDRMRVDVQAEFYVRVQPTAESIANAAQTLGRRTMEPQALKELVEGKFVDALRAVAAEEGRVERAAVEVVAARLVTARVAQIGQDIVGRLEAQDDRPRELDFALAAVLDKAAARNARADAGEGLQRRKWAGRNDRAERVGVGKVGAQLLLLMGVAGADGEAELIGDIEDIVGEQRPVVAALTPAIIDRLAVEGQAREPKRRRDIGESTGPERRRNAEGDVRVGPACCSRGKPRRLFLQ